MLYCQTCRWENEVAASKLQEETHQWVNAEPARPATHRVFVSQDGGAHVDSIQSVCEAHLTGKGAAQPIASDEYLIRADRLPEVSKLIDKLAPRAKACKVAAPTLDVLGEQVVTRWVEDEWAPSQRREEHVACLIVKVEIARPVIDGWEFLAKLEASEGGNIVSACPSYEDRLKPEWRTLPSYCDHCKSYRRRNATFIVEKEGVTKQVGSTCLKDFAGLSGTGESLLSYLDGVLSALERIGGAGADDEEGLFRGGERLTPIDELLTHVALIVRTQGWVSRGKARDFGGVASVDCAVDNIEAQRRKSTYKGKPLWVDPTEADAELAKKALAWVRETQALQPVEERSDYIHNLVVACAKDYASYRHFGIIGSAVSAYQRSVEKEVQAKVQAEHAASNPSNHLGVVGGKLEVKGVTVTGLRSVESQFGVTTLITFEDAEGNIIKWWASAAILPAVGEKVTLKGTVKKHDTFRGVADTTLTRCKFKEEA